MRLGFRRGSVKRDGIGSVTYPVIYFICEARSRRGRGVLEQNNKNHGGMYISGTGGKGTCVRCGMLGCTTHNSGALRQSHLYLIKGSALSYLLRLAI